MKKIKDRIKDISYAATTLSQLVGTSIKSKKIKGFKIVIDFYNPLNEMQRKEFLSLVNNKNWQVIINKEYDKIIYKLRPEEFETKLKNAALFFGCHIKYYKNSLNDDAVFARAYTYFYLYEKGLTFVEIGDLFGRSHSTIRHGLSVFKTIPNHSVTYEKFKLFLDDF